MTKTRIELSIKTTYLPNWGAYEGIRELTQNARDSEIEFNAPMNITWYNDTLRIENEGVILERKVLLLGQTSKEGNSAMIGKFGEGLKLGVLALLRAGHQVKIRNGSEVWEPKLESSSVFLGEQVIAFHITSGRKHENRVRIEVGNITKNAWDEIKTKFLFLDPPQENEIVKSSYGELLINPKFCGKIFVKGIFVQNYQDISFGYNLYDVTLDRDRKMVESWNLAYSTRGTLLCSVNKRPEILGKFYSLLENNEKEAKSIDSGNLYTLSETSQDKIVKTFTEKYGEDAVPVENLDQSKSMDHLGKRGVVVSKALYTVIAARTGGFNSMLSKLNEEVISNISWNDLSNEERNNLEGALAEVSKVTTVGDVIICCFRNTNIYGQFKDDKVYLSKNILTDYYETLATLIHEAAHRKGDDGEHNHIAEIERIWKKVHQNK